MFALYVQFVATIPIFSAVVQFAIPTIIKTLEIIRSPKAEFETMINEVDLSVPLKFLKPFLK